MESNGALARRVASSTAASPPLLLRSVPLPLLSALEVAVAKEGSPGGSRVWRGRWLGVFVGHALGFWLELRPWMAVRPRRAGQDVWRAPGCAARVLGFGAGLTGGQGREEKGRLMQAGVGAAVGRSCHEA